MKMILSIMALTAIFNTAAANESEQEISRALFYSLEDKTANCEVVIESRGEVYNQFSHSIEDIKSVALEAGRNYNVSVDSSQTPTVVEYIEVGRFEANSTTPNAGVFWTVNFKLSADEKNVVEVELTQTEVAIREVNTGTIPSPNYSMESVEKIIKKEVCKIESDVNAN
ncbi:MAG: hypothetical protein VYA54_10090 [Bdellovibrionota bacterium]|nr:hypothetical protein [Bdellovibrionota bacterium]